MAVTGQHGNEQTTLAGDAGSADTTPTASRALGVQSAGPTANRMTGLNPTAVLSLMRVTPELSGMQGTA